MRPRKFDGPTVLEQALEAFWSGGLAGTSIDDLQRATGLSRSSLYSFAGPREAWLRLIVEHYVEWLNAMLDSTFSGGGLRAGLTRLFVDAATDNFAGKGCLLANGINELRGYRAEHLAVVRDGLEKVRHKLVELLGHVAPELPDPDGRSAEIMCAVIGIRTMQRAGASPHTLTIVAENFAAALSTHDRSALEPRSVASREAPHSVG